MKRSLITLVVLAVCVASTGCAGIKAQGVLTITYGGATATTTAILEPSQAK